MEHKHTRVTQSVKLPDPVHKAAKEEAEERDISIGAVIDSWHRDAIEWRNRGSDVL